MSEETYRVKGMTCHGCERSVELAVSNAPGVKTVKADASSGTIKVQFAEANIGDDAIRQAVEKSGYTYIGK